eukprot:jgi/Botrbrau1/18609/Bobra.0367s0049.1
MVRFKNRHLIVQLIWKDGKIDTSIDEKIILTALRKSIVTNFGDVGGGLTNASLRVGFYSPLSNVCLIRCGRDHKRQVIAALAFITAIAYRAVLVRLLRVCGTLTNCKRMALDFNTQLMEGVKQSEKLLELQGRAITRLQELRD